MSKRGLGRGIGTIIPDGASETVESGRETPAEQCVGAPWGPAEIGGLLRSRRESRRLSLDDVQAATKIRKRYLQALEAGEDTSSPGDVYFRGFLKIYGDFLGLDGQALVRQYKAAKTPPEPPATVSPAPTAGEAVPPRDAAPVEAAPAPQEAPAPSPARRRPRSPARVWRLPFVLFLTAILALVMSTRIMNDMVPPPAAGPPAPVEAQSQPAPPPGTNPPASPEQQAPPPAPPAEAEPEIAREDRSEYLTVIGIKAEALDLSASVKDGPCWVRVEADGKVIAEELLEPGARRAWRATDRLVIRVGAPWTMSLSLNGVDLGIAGREGGPAKDLEISRTE
ncbi:MAG: helix-turn-helix domain-containing protein [Ignavibacteriales bacterium]